MERLGKYFAVRNRLKLNSLPFLVAERERERCVEFSDFQIRSKRVGLGELGFSLAIVWTSGAQQLKVGRKGHFG